ncbi:MAG: zinc ribbon domain-containing protein [Treponema sp.]|jgi:hypothetical protein|nr:zinc ribbon domain-containing protein [Treponema sp.]
MFCKNCGTQVKEDAAFCGNCGAQAGAAAQRPIQNAAHSGQILAAPYQPPQAAPAAYAPSYQQARAAVQGPGSKLRPLFILSIIAPLIYAAYLVIGWGNGYADPDYETGGARAIVDGVVLFGCLLVQGIMAFVQSIKRKKASITVTAVVALLWYLVVLIGFIGVSAASDYNYVANIIFGGLWSLQEGYMPLLWPVFTIMWVYPLVFCVLSMVWCAAKKAQTATSGTAVLAVLIIVVAIANGLSPSMQTRGNTGSDSPQSQPQAQTQSQTQQTNEPRQLWSTGDGMSINPLKSGLRKIAGGYTYYTEEAHNGNMEMRKMRGPA